MKKLRVLHIGNGKAFKIKTIIDFFKERGHEIHFIPTPPTDERWEGIIYHQLKPFGKFSKLQVLKNIFHVRKIVKEIKPDIIHAHTAGGPGWYGAFCQYHPYVIHTYGSDVLPFHYSIRNVFPKILTMYTCRQADKIIVTGEHMVEASSHLKIPKNKFKILPRGVNLKRFGSGLDTTELRIKLQINNASPIILSPRYQIEKSYYNFDTIIKSIAHIKKFYPNVLFLQLYSESKEREKKELEQMARNLGVESNYKMVRAVENEDMPLFYNLADIVVSVPSTDGFPVSVLEASACGVPMIVTKLDFTSEWFIDEENGILIPVRDPIALANAVVRLLEDRELQEKMIIKNRKQVEKRADYEKCMIELEQIYYKLLSANSS
jgi:glycosyltransferase involved in cell wall biosynthesis